jgi:hypothetical protein
MLALAILAAHSPIMSILNMLLSLNLVIALVFTYIFSFMFHWSNLKCSTQWYLKLTPLNIYLTVEKSCGIDDKDLRLMIQLIVSVVAMGINVLPNHHILVALQDNSTEILVNRTSTKEDLVNFLNECFWLWLCLLMTSDFIFSSMQRLCMGQCWDCLFTWLSLHI